MATLVKPWVHAAKKYDIIELILGVVVFTLNHFGLLSQVFKKSVTVAAVDVPTAPTNAKTSGLKEVADPTSELSTIGGSTPKLELMAWNSQMGLIYANGGQTTTKGSLFERHGVKLKIIRQDATSTSLTNLINFAKGYQKDTTTALNTGSQFVIDMGDGWPQDLASINKTLLALDGGKGDYVAEVVFAAGRSNGEDALLGQPEWLQDPQKARGALISTVILQGDWNIAYRFFATNHIPINTDERTYDPEAANFVNAENGDFIKSGDRYIAGKPVTLKLVDKNGKFVKDTAVQITGVASWSPADVNVAEQRGGLVRIISTADYNSQMPAVVITIKKYAEDHRKYIENMIRAVTEGSDQIKSFSGALTKAGELSAKVYNDRTGAFWTKLDTGYVITDRKNLKTKIGGSMQYNLADNLNLFGLTPGSSNVYESVYKTFVDIDLTTYGERFKDTPFVPFEKAFDPSYLQAVMADKDAPVTAAETQNYVSDNNSGRLVGEQPWRLEFNSASAVVKPESEATLGKLYDQLVQTNLKIELDGYTDNTGDIEGNKTLSQKRAEAVKAYLQQRSENNFPESRFIAVKGYGSDSPVGNNNTSAGRAANRRVKVVLKQNN